MSMEIGLYGLGRMGGDRVKGRARRAGRRRAGGRSALGLRFVDGGVSGGIWGLELGYCMMVGGPEDAVDHLRPLLDTLAPPNGWARFGKSGAGHFGKTGHT